MEAKRVVRPLRPAAPAPAAAFRRPSIGERELACGRKIRYQHLMGVPASLAALALLAAPASGAEEADFVWACGFTAAYDCDAGGCRKVAPPRERVSFSTGGDNYFRCLGDDPCAGQPAVMRMKDDTMLVDVPGMGTSARFSRDGTVVETRIEPGLARSAFGRCSISEEMPTVSTSPR
jgi:hypothetical protein